MPLVPPDPFADDAATAVAAATVVPLRDGPEGIESLLLLRASGLSFAGGMWVWPGGRIDDSDRAGALDAHPDAASDPALAEEWAARVGAAREAEEEAGLSLDPGTMVWFSHWTPPAENPKRFRTHFFATAVDADTEVTVDGGEILEHRWMSATEALSSRDAGTLGLTPPTAITLAQLTTFDDVASALASFASRPPEFFVTRFAKVRGGAAALYHGDSAYGGGDADEPGARHRLWMLEDRWWYERTI